MYVRVVRGPKLIHDIPDLGAKTSISQWSSLAPGEGDGIKNNNIVHMAHVGSLIACQNASV